MTSTDNICTGISKQLLYCLSQISDSRCICLLNKFFMGSDPINSQELFVQF